MGKLKMIQKDEEVRNNVQRELERRVLWSRKMDVRRKERSLITKQLKKEQAAKQEEYRQKSAQREKEILKMKKIQNASRKVASKLRDEKRRDAQIKAIKEAKEREERKKQKKKKKKNSRCIPPLKRGDQPREFFFFFFFF